MANTPGMTQPWALDGHARTRTWTPTLLAQLVVVLAVLVSGVTGAGVLRSRHGGTDVLSVVQAAGSSALRARTFRATFDLALSGPGLNVTGSGQTLIDTENKRSSGYFELPAVGRLDLVQVGPHAYVKIPGGRADSTGKHWFEFTAPGTASSAVGGQDPMAFLHLLADPKDVKAVGQERVNDVDTTHYTVQLDPERVAALGAKQGITNLPPEALTQLRQLGVDVWIDGDTLPRRMVMSFAKDQADFRFTMNFFDYDGAVVVTEPPADDVTAVASPQQIGALIAGLRNG